MIGDCVTHMGFVGSCGHCPVNVTRVVTGYVGSSFSVLGSVTGEEAGMITGEETIETAQDGDSQPVDRDLGRSGGPVSMWDLLSVFEVAAVSAHVNPALPELVTRVVQTRGAVRRRW
jgi:hypothetical protein